jgi:hypothetical protein
VALVKALLEKSATKRLGVDETKAHRFFGEIDWVKLLSLDVPPPVVPDVSNPRDISCVPDKYTKGETPMDSPVSPSSLLSPTNAADLFSGFTFDGEDSGQSALLHCELVAQVAGREAQPASVTDASGKRGKGGDSVSSHGTTSPASLSPSSSSIERTSASGRRSLVELDLDVRSKHPL